MSSKHGRVEPPPTFDMIDSVIKSNLKNSKDRAKCRPKSTYRLQVCLYQIFRIIVLEMFLAEHGPVTEDIVRSRQ